ncbi:NADH-FMN oxidoreductase RutF, flavin reductase (DIM6/NTAB) family, partial [Streptomyces sp. DvalAA-14]|uniref:flavin reductase family protein n=1 Tax=unclassified Streptomyces TaxID=2593676 RepID=UPI00081BC10B
MTVSTAAPRLGPVTVDRDDFCATMTQLPSGASVVTTTGPDGPIGCTVTSLVSLSADPPAVLVSLASTSRTLVQAVAAGGFAVNVLSWQQRDLCRRFAQGDPSARFDGVPYTLTDGLPVLDDHAAVLVCRLDRTVEVADHTLLVGLPTVAA